MTNLIAEFFIEGELPTMNEIIRDSKKHWAAYANSKKVNTGLVSFSARGIEPIDEQVNVHCHWILKDRRKDKDNITAGQKYIFDGVVEAGILVNDGWQEIGDIHHSFAVDRQRPGVLVRLYAVKEEDGYAESVRGS